MADRALADRAGLGARRQLTPRLAFPTGAHPAGGADRRAADAVVAGAAAQVRGEHLIEPPGVLIEAGIRRIDVEAARSLPGVTGARTLADLEALPPLPDPREAAADGAPRLFIRQFPYRTPAGREYDSGEYGSVEVLPNGTVVARSGSTRTGQSHPTVFCQVVASAWRALRAAFGEFSRS